MDATSELARPRFKVLLVEDDLAAADHIQSLIREWGYAARVSPDGRSVRATVLEWEPHLALVDLGLADSERLGLLRELRARAVESVVMTGRATINSAMETVASGASVLLEKPVSPATLRSVLADAERRVATAPHEGESHDGVQTLDAMLSASPKMHGVFDLIRCVAPTDASVLITGENGTGKELVANAIHALSPRAGGPFVKVNCAAIPDDLIESELFGHRRGAFTGAVMDHAGLFASAAGGTLLLDEIGEMAPNLQTKLLRVLQDRQAWPIGGLKPVALDFRLICATNTDLRRAATAGQFRQDLYFRIDTIGIDIPPLRERREDILLLAEHFVELFARRYRRRFVTLDDSARDLLVRHDWRGNVRELEHAVERAVIVSRGKRLRADDFPDALQRLPKCSAGVTAPPIMPLAELERLAIIRTLEHTRGNKRAAASILGVYRPTLYSKLRKYGITTVQ